MPGLASAGGGVCGREFNEFSISRVVGAPLTPPPLSPRLGPWSGEQSILSRTDISEWECGGSAREPGRGPDPANAGKATKAGSSMPGPSNNRLVFSLLSKSQRRGWLGGNGVRMERHCPRWGRPSGPPGSTPHTHEALHSHSRQSSQASGLMKGKWEVGESSHAPPCHSRRVRASGFD